MMINIFLFLSFFSVGTLMAQEVGLPSPPRPAGNYRPYKIAGKLIYINQVAFEQGLIKHPGTIGEGVSMDQAEAATKASALNVLAVLKEAVGGDLGRVKQAVQLTGYFKTAPEFKGHSALLNVASDLFIKVLGPRGQHARAAVGVTSLPLDSSNELQAIFELN